MNPRNRKSAFAAACFLCLAVLLLTPRSSNAKAQNGPPQYSVAEYNALMAAQAEQNPAQQMALLANFVRQYPDSALNVYVYKDYSDAALKAGNYAKAFEYADRLGALDGVVDTNIRLAAAYNGASAYAKLNSNDRDMAAKGRALAENGLQIIPFLTKPANVDDATWLRTKTQVTQVFYMVGARSSMVLTDYPSAARYCNAGLNADPDQASRGFFNYMLGHFYEKGLGVPQDSAQAAALFAKASAAGYSVGEAAATYAANNAPASQASAADAQPAQQQADAQSQAQANAQSQADAQAQAGAQAQAAADAKAQEEAERRQDRINGLENEIEELKSEAQNWDQTAESITDDTCVGPGAGICRAIGAAGRAKARANADKARKKVRADQRELNQLGVQATASDDDDPN